MDTFIDYSTYTLEELLQARDTIDATAYPERVAELDKLISEKSTETDNAISEPATVLREVDVKFHGNTKEFFSIWIVNLLLTIVTLGIYSAWAKVRTNRYFYSSTEIDGHRFSYLAEPLQILKGRIIAIAFFVTLFISVSINPIFSLVIFLLVVPLYPLIILLSVRFKLRMTGYRNVRFQFAGSYGQAFILIVLLPFASIFTLYLLLPWVLKKIDEFLVNEMSFGDKPFSTSLDVGQYYFAGLGAVFSAFFISVIGVTVINNTLSSSLPENSYLLSIGMFALYLLLYAVSSSIYHAIIRNHIFNTSEIEGVATFSSTLSVPGLMALRLTNTLAMILSLGMAIPWTKIRSAKFFADATQVTVLSGIEDVMAGAEGSNGAIAEETATLFDADLSLG